MGSMYNDALDNLRFSDTEKAQMVERLLAAAESADSEDASPIETGAEISAILTAEAEPQPKPALTAIEGKAPRKRTARSFKAIAAAAAVVAVFVVGGGIAYATGGLVTLQQAFDDIFNGPPARTEVADKIGHPVDAVASSNGITVSADAVIGDATHLTIVYSVVRDDGEAFDTRGDVDGRLPYMFRTEDIDAGRFESMLGSIYFYDANPEDAAIQMVQQLEFSGNDSLVGKTARVNLRDLMRVGETEEQTVTHKGEWALKFELNYEDASIKLPAGQTFSLNGMTATVDSIMVSPIAFTVAYTVDEAMPDFDEPSGKMSDELSAAMDRYLGIGDVSVIMADGTVYTQGTNGGGSMVRDGNVEHCDTGFFFERIIDVDEVVAVTILGMTVTRG